jgi:hypothetical protein
MFSKVAQTVAQPKNAKIFASKLNLNVQNMYIKQLLKPYNTYDKPCFEIANLGKIVKHLLKQKVTK